MLDGLVIDASLDHLDLLVARLRPRDLVYVAVDGAPPRSKMNQQRSRRFMTAWRRGCGIDGDGGWDRNAITPGTAFMDRLAAALAQYQPRRWHCRVVVSDSKEPGEGEQKIFADIRSQSAASAPQSLLIYGLDADLMLMSLLLPVPLAASVRIVREQQNAADGLQVIDVKKLSRGVSERMRHASDAEGTAEEIEACRARDFVALCLLLGNDFVPSLPGMSIRDGAVDTLVRCYKAVRGSRCDGRRLSTGGPDCAGGLDLGVLLSLLRAVADLEDGGMAQADRRFYDRCRGAARTPTAGRDPEDFPIYNPPPPSVRPGNDSAWRMRYYLHVFGRSAVDAGTVRGICLAYVAGVAWTLRYMEQECLSHGWYYPHDHAPTALDICSLLIDDQLLVGREIARHIEGATAPPPAWQLLMVLPPSSAPLVPDARQRRLMSDPEAGCVHMFPLRFTIATYLRSKLWECTPVLPPIDLQTVRRALMD